MISDSWQHGDSGKIFFQSVCDYFDRAEIIVLGLEPDVVGRQVPGKDDHVQVRLGVLVTQSPDHALTADQPHLDVRQRAVQGPGRGVASVGAPVTSPRVSGVTGLQVSCAAQGVVTLSGGTLGPWGITNMCTLHLTLTYGVVGLNVEIRQLEDPSDGPAGGGGGRGRGRDLVKLRDIQGPVSWPGRARAAAGAQHHAADVATGQAVLTE